MERKSKRRSKFVRRRGMGIKTWITDKKIM